MGGDGKGPATMLGSRGPDGKPQAVAIGCEGRRRATHRNGPLYRVRGRVDRGDRAVELVRDPEGARRGAERVRAVPDRDRRLHSSGGGLEAGVRAGDLVRVPNIAGRAGYGRRCVVPTSMESEFWVSGVDTRDPGRDD